MRVAAREVQHHGVVGRGVAEAVDGRHRRDDDDVAALEQRLRRRQAHLLDVLVDRGVFLDIGVASTARRLPAGSSRSTRRSTRPRCAGRTRATRRRAAPRASCCARGSASAAAARSITWAIENVLPLPVTPSSVCLASPLRARRRAARSPAADRPPARTETRVGRVCRSFRGRLRYVAAASGFFKPAAGRRPRPVSAFRLPRLRGPKSALR